MLSLIWLNVFNLMANESIFTLLSESKMAKSASSSSGNLFTLNSFNPAHSTICLHIGVVTTIIIFLIIIFKKKYSQNNITY